MHFRHHYIANTEIRAVKRHSQFELLIKQKDKSTFAREDACMSNKTQITNF